MTALAARPSTAVGSLTHVVVRRHEHRVAVQSRVSVAEPGTPTLRPMLIRQDEAAATICLVPDGALLLGGDSVTVRIDVEDGATLTVVEPGGTVAYPSGGATADWTVDLRLGDHATLIWAGEPFVLTERSHVYRRTRAVLAPTSRLALREVLVLGRTGEHVDSGTVSFEASRPNGDPLLVESLDIADAGLPGVLGGRRALGSVTALGFEAPPDRCADGRLDLAESGTIWRHLAGAAHELSTDPWDAVRETLSTSAI